ncbi:major capsid protein [Kitasatospora fiedleri]|uniref:major capsid protein n=1 Tax=Kitasatospora fiedleri TaxID=2991545 RepID=UPI002499CE66|nr:major capsid protein [Kitasatospora fiedleri]
MQLNDEYATPAELTGYAREALRDYQVNMFSLHTYLPDNHVNDLSYKFTKGGGNLVDAAVYRNYDSESDIGRREGGASVWGELPPISRKMPLGEYERLTRRNLDTRAEELRAALETDATRLVQGIAARVEMARGEALFNASISLNENGVIGGVDFGRSAGNTVAAGTMWDDVTAPVSDDIETWMEYYLALNGFVPDRMVMPRRVFNFLRRNNQMKNIIFPNSGKTIASIPTLTPGQLNDALSAAGLPAAEVYDAQVTVSGVSTRVTPPNKVALLPPPNIKIGETLWGSPIESQDPRYGLAGAEAGVAVGAYYTEDPQTLWTRATAIVLPIIGNPDVTMTATVLAS